MNLSRQELTAVLNALWTEGVERVTVEHPCTEVGTLLEIDLDVAEESTVRIRAGRQTYNSRREAVHLDHGTRAYEDLPDAHTYCQALTAGGLVDVHNAGEIDSFLERHAYPDLEAGHPPVFAGIDANIFPWRVPEVLGIDPQRPEYDDQRPPINGYALSSGVESELDWQFKQRHTQQIAEAFGPEFERLEDQPAGSRRAGFLGSAAFRRLRANRRSEVIETAEGDEAIVEGYREWAANGRKNVVLFSNDRGFVNRATDTGVPAVRVEYPVGTPQTVTATWDEIRDTLYVLAVVFGVLKLPKLTLYGVWNGKTGHHWRAQEVDVVARSPAVETRLERDRSVLDAYDTR
jgi:rRNA-processing protein FCF1